jgi:hypothetical protein
MMEQSSQLSGRSFLMALSDSNGRKTELLFLSGYLLQLTKQSIRLSALLLFFISFFINIATFTGAAGFSTEFTLPLFIIQYVFGAVMILIYVILQIVLVVNTLDDRWPLGDVLFGFAFLVIAQIFELVVSTQICTLAKHYIDGLFFGSIFILLAVMMVLFNHFNCVRCTSIGIALQERI